MPENFDEQLKNIREKRANDYHQKLEAEKETAKKEKMDSFLIHLEQAKTLLSDYRKNFYNIWLDDTLDEEGNRLYFRKINELERTFATLLNDINQLANDFPLDSSKLKKLSRYLDNLKTEYYTQAVVSPSQHCFNTFVLPLITEFTECCNEFNMAFSNNNNNNQTKLIPSKSNDEIFHSLFQLKDDPSIKERKLDKKQAEFCLTTLQNNLEIIRLKLHHRLAEKHRAWASYKQTVFFCTKVISDYTEESDRADCNTKLKEAEKLLDSVESELEKIKAFIQPIDRFLQRIKAEKQAKCSSTSTLFALTDNSEEIYPLSHELYCYLSPPDQPLVLESMAALQFNFTYLKGEVSFLRPTSIAESNNNNHSSMISRLPQDILADVLRQADISDVVNFSKTSKTFHEFVGNTNRIWKGKVKERSGLATLIDQKKDSNVNYKNLYVNYETFDLRDFLAWTQHTLVEECVQKKLAEKQKEYEVEKKQFELDKQKRISAAKSAALAIKKDIKAVLKKYISEDRKLVDGKFQGNRLLKHTLSGIVFSNNENSINELKMKYPLPAEDANDLAYFNGGSKELEKATIYCQALYKLNQIQTIDDILPFSEWLKISMENTDKNLKNRLNTCYAFACRTILGLRQYEQKENNKKYVEFNERYTKNYLENKYTAQYKDSVAEITNLIALTYPQIVERHKQVWKNNYPGIMSDPDIMSDCYEYKHRVSTIYALEKSINKAIDKINKEPYLTNYKCIRISDISYPLSKQISELLLLVTRWAEKGINLHQVGVEISKVVDPNAQFEAIRQYDTKAYDAIMDKMHQLFPDAYEAKLLKNAENSMNNNHTLQKKTNLNWSIFVQPNWCVSSLYTTTMKKTDTLKNLKEQIKAKYGFKKGELSLFFGGRKLATGRNLDETLGQVLSHEATVDICRRPK